MSLWAVAGVAVALVLAIVLVSEGELYFEERRRRRRINRKSEWDSRYRL